jgi:YidC/Oxa1 family membrane protein insertase
MDRKAILILIGCFALMLFWPALVDRIFPPPPKPPPGTNRLAQAGTLATNLVASTNVTTSPASPPVISAPASPTVAWVPPAGPEELLVFETEEARYTFTSHGGGLKLVELKGYPATVACGRKARTGEVELATLNAGAPVPALALFGGAALEDSVPFKLTRTAQGVRAEKALGSGVRIVKEFVAGTNNLLAASVRLENAGGSPVALPPQELVIGTATPINRRDDGHLLGLQWYDGERAQFIDNTWFLNAPAWGCGCVPGTPRAEFLSAGVSNVVWAAAHNQFFVMIAAPRTNAPAVVARKIHLPPPSAAETAEDRRVVAQPFGIQTAFVYPTATLAPGQTVEWVLDVFAGPKEYHTLAKLSRNQDQAMRFTTFFGWFARALLLGMNGLHGLGLSYGLAIIVITIIVKLLFWPLTQASSRSMKRMAALQPQMKEIQEKYKDDPKKMNQKLMEFMKEHKVSPLGGCLPILLQIPVFIGFYQMLQSAIELRGARFLWACDLSQPDTVAVIFGFPINPLPLIMGATQFWQARLTPVSPGVDPVQQKMMQYMPLIFIFILYNFSAGLALYWTVQNLLSILQMKLIKNLNDPAAKPPAPPAPGKPLRPGGPARKK